MERQESAIGVERPATGRSRQLQNRITALAVDGYGDRNASGSAGATLIGTGLFALVRVGGAGRWWTVRDAVADGMGFSRCPAQGRSGEQPREQRTSASRSVGRIARRGDRGRRVARLRGPACGPRRGHSGGADHS